MVTVDLTKNEEEFIEYVRAIEKKYGKAGIIVLKNILNNFLLFSYLKKNTDENSSSDKT